MTPKEVYDLYQRDTAQDMWDYSPLFVEIAKGNILEIGVRGGVSTAAFLFGLEEREGHLYSIDIDKRCEILYKDNPKWTFINEDSKNVDIIVPQLPAIDILFIDGDHSYEGCKSDLENYSKIVVGGGIIFVHDVAPTVDITPEMISRGWFDLTGVRKAYDEFVNDRDWLNEILPGRFGMGKISKPNHRCFYHPNRSAKVRDNSESQNSKIYLCDYCVSEVLTELFNE